jgi:hypothetical protein
MSHIPISGHPNSAPQSAPGKSYKELAIWSVICAIWMAMVGIILGMMALLFMRASNNFDGKNIALAGIIIGAISTVGYVFVALANGPALGLLLGGAITSCVPLYFVAQIWFACAWPGRWRIAALVPIIGFVAALYYTLAGLEHGSNLWPFPLIFFAPLGLVYLMIARIARAFVDKREGA